MRGVESNTENRENLVAFACMFGLYRMPVIKKHGVNSLRLNEMTCTSHSY